MPFQTGLYNENNGTYSLISGNMPRLNSIRRVVNRDGFRTLTELVNTLVGAEAGSPAVASHARVGAQFSNNDANNEAPVVTVTDINRNSTDNDVTKLKSFLFGVRARPAYPADKSGNGGGALV